MFTCSIKYMRGEHDQGKKFQVSEASRNAKIVVHESNCTYPTYCEGSILTRFTCIHICYIPVHYFHYLFVKTNFASLNKAML